MASIEELVRFENENTALTFRASRYDSENYERFLIDVIAMANACLNGQRVIVLGVDAHGRDRTLIGIEDISDDYRAELTRLVSDFVEPALDIDLSTVSVDDKTLGLILIKECGDQPYMIKEDYSLSLQAGDAWVRKGSHQLRMKRADFESVYGSRFARPGLDGLIRIGFGERMFEILKLAVFGDAGLPSADAAKRIAAAIKAKEASKEILGHDDTDLGRLMHVKYFGADAPFEMRSVATLRQNLAMVKNEYHSQDLYYLFEKQAHRVNLTLANQGAEDLRDASVILELPREKGLEVADRIYTAPVAAGGDTSRNRAAERYPNVELGEKKIRVYAGLGDVPQDTPVTVFLEPLRLLLRKELVGESIPVRYTIKARNLDEPIIGMLQIAAAKA